MDLHELQAERNARVQLLQQSQGDAIAHLEQVVGAMLLVMPAKELAQVQAQLAKIGTVDENVESIVHLYGEVSPDVKVKSRREMWRAELADLEAKIAQLEASGVSDEMDTQ